jgi:hypothetical protein
MPHLRGGGTVAFWLQPAKSRFNTVPGSAVSRGAEEAQLFTNDREKLLQALGHDVSHESAHVPAMKPEQAITPPQPEIAPVIEHGMGLGHSL